MRPLLLSLLVLTACPTVPDKDGGAGNADPTDDTGADGSDGGSDGAQDATDADGDGYSETEGDCDDDDSHRSPSAPDLAGDGIDQNCDGTDGIDFDGDGVASTVSGGEDCDDTHAEVQPGAEELCDALDNDCDGSVDGAGATGASSWFVDSDGDSFGDPDSLVIDCEAPEAGVSDGTDCNDTDPTIHPDSEERCGGADENCDGAVDEPEAVDAAPWYEDTDADGYGDPLRPTLACTQPLGYSAEATDCDDSDGLVFPSATELCDGQWNDCSAFGWSLVGAPDEELDDDGDGYVECAAGAAAWVGDPILGYADCLDTGTGAEWTFPGVAFEDDASACMADADGDGWGDEDATGLIQAGTDCDDADPETNPGYAGWLGPNLPSDCSGLSHRTPAFASATLLGNAELMYFGWSLGATDFDGDSNAELIVAANPAGAYTDRIYIYDGASVGSGQHSSSSYLAVLGFDSNRFALVDDKNGDGIEDLFAVHYDDWLLVSGAQLALGGTVASSSSLLHVTLGDVETIVNAGDLDGDGISDVLIADNQRAALILGSSIDPATTSTLSGVDANWSSSSYGFGQHVAALGDVDSDGYADFFVGDPLYDASGSWADDEVGCLAVRLGASTWSSSTGNTCPAFGDFSVIGVGHADRVGFQAQAVDIDGDTSSELLVATHSGRVLFDGTTVVAGGSVLRTAATLAVAGGVSTGTTYSPAMASCDLDADGTHDLLSGDGWVTGSAAEGVLYLHLGADLALASGTADASATFQGLSSGDVLSAGIACADADADGDLDIWTSAPAVNDSYTDVGAVYLFTNSW